MESFLLGMAMLGTFLIVVGFVGTVVFEDWAYLVNSRMIPRDNPWVRLSGILILIGGLIVIPALVFGSCANAETVTTVHDGDSFHVAEFKQEVRIWGIDAPEVHAPPGVRGHQEGQPYGIEARDYLRSILMGKTVQLECPHAKSHKRPVCSVFLNGIDIGDNLVRFGLAFDEPHFTQAYQSAEAEARSKGVGVWKLPNGGQRPWDYRRQMRVK